MSDLFNLATLITTVGVDAVKIKQEPDLPEKSSNEILTELFSTFDVDEGVSSPINSQNESNSDDQHKKKKKKSKKKHKHKDKKHKKKIKKNSSGSESESQLDSAIKRKKKHKKKLKRKRSDLSDSSDNEEPKLKIKKEILSPESKKASRTSRSHSMEDSRPQTVFDLVQSVIKKEPDLENDEFDIKPNVSDSPELPPISKKINDDLEEPVVPRLLEKTDQPNRAKILIKDLKNSAVYNETVKEVENKKKEKEARMEDGELSESMSDERTPTLSPTPPRDSFDSLDDSSVIKPNHHIKNDLRLVLNQKEKTKKNKESGELKTRNDDDIKKDKKKSDNFHRRSSRSSERKRSRSCHSRDRKMESTRSHSKKRSRSRGKESKRTKSSERRNRNRSSDRKSVKNRGKRHGFDSHDSWRSRSEDKNRDRSRGRSRSKERKERIEIDKKKLLEIARKNAINMIKRGTLPLAQQDKAIAAIQAGGKTVDELIDFCKSLSKSEALGELSSVSSDEGGNNSESEKGFHHPFLLKERPNSIIMNIRDSKQLPTKTFQERTAESSNQLRLQFPVSSGQQHRRTENEWIDVTPPTPPVPPPPVKKLEAKKPFVAASTPLQPPAFTIIPPANSTVVPLANSTVVPPPPAVAVVTPTPVAETPINDPKIPQPLPTVFPQATPEAVDIGTIVSQRLAAMRKLRENPNDVQALNEMYHAQNEMKTWAESKQMPGQFTGSTGVKVLSPAELTAGYQAWARKAFNYKEESTSAA
ncbi:protein SON-like isoform X2 [Chelonus insularis]|uniref:protein SON-like isoform X2 n=1 Tax=Chelonus insularis TaxID=460826 RepID=UPI00158F57C3|nr:protein SON-like isoform X2 [Chelonus insularis]